VPFFQQCGNARAIGLLGMDTVEGGGERVHVQTCQRRWCDADLSDRLAAEIYREKTAP
jgi:hypothetical protein